MLGVKRAVKAEITVAMACGGRAISHSNRIPGASEVSRRQPGAAFGGLFAGRPGLGAGLFGLGPGVGDVVSQRGDARLACFDGDAGVGQFGGQPLGFFLAGGVLLLQALKPRPGLDLGHAIVQVVFSGVQDRRHPFGAGARLAARTYRLSRDQGFELCRLACMDSSRRSFSVVRSLGTVDAHPQYVSLAAEIAFRLRRLPLAKRVPLPPGSRHKPWVGL
jgi:hypothetical protein